jgi:hypothetical protein
MSSTRRAKADGSFRQEKYASSPEFDLGLNAVLVAKRCSVLIDPQEIELIWFLQYLSHLPGSLKVVTEEVLARNPDRIGTEPMHKAGIRKGGKYAAAEVRLIRDEFRGPFDHDEFLLNGEQRLSLLDSFPEGEGGVHPTSYPVAAFLDICRGKFLDDAPDLLRELCLNPELVPAQISIGVFRELFQALLDLAADHAEERLKGLVKTDIGKSVLGRIDYAEQQKCLVVIEGNARTGKSFVTKAWCEALPGRRRYIQVPSSNDMTVFFRAIAKALGIPASYTRKAQELRARISDVLQSGQLTVALDEAHYLFPQTNVRRALPNRINWMLTELVNFGVSVALISTPQFTSSQRETEKTTHWASEQLIGRIAHYTRLPDRLGKHDLEAVARFHLPEGDSKSIAALVAYAQASKKYLAGIEHATKEARYESKLQGRDRVTFDDIKRAIETSVMPSDQALQAALSPVRKDRRERLSIAPAEPVQPHFRPSESLIPEREGATTFFAPRGM